MNDITLDELKKDQKVYFFVKPSDKLPTLISSFDGGDIDDRGREYANIRGVGFVPVYHVRPVPETYLLDPATQHGAGLPGKHIVQPVKGIDY